jgi:ubiquitin C-terminal hydrolase
MSLDPSAIDTNNDIMDFESAIITTIDGDQINAAAASTKMKRDLRSSLQKLNPLSSNRGLKNSSVLCYSNSYLQVLASYRDLPDCLCHPPSDNERRFPIFFELATIIISIRCGQGNPVCTETFTKLFREKNPAFDTGQCKLSLIIS